MLIISASLPKSGSGYFYNLLNDMMISAGHADTREIRSNYRLKWLKGYNCFIKSISLSKLLRMWVISLKSGAFAVKTHRPISNLPMIFFHRLRLIKIVYIYRDPRDALLSAIDRGRHVIDFENGIEELDTWLQWWMAYKKKQENFDD